MKHAMARRRDAPNRGQRGYVGCLEYTESYNKYEPTLHVQATLYMYILMLCNKRSLDLQTIHQASPVK